LNNVEEIFGLQRKSSWALRTAHGICTLPNGKVDTRDIIRAFEAERGLCPVVSRAPGGLGYFGRSSCQRCQSCGVSSSVGLEGGGGIWSHRIGDEWGASEPPSFLAPQLGYAKRA